MTHFSRNGSPGSDVDAIAADLQRQREDLKRLRRAAGNSSSETAAILQKLEDLRRRSEARRSAGSPVEDRDRNPAAKREAERKDTHR